MADTPSRGVAEQLLPFRRKRRCLHGAGFVEGEHELCAAPIDSLTFEGSPELLGLAAVLTKLTSQADRTILQNLCFPCRPQGAARMRKRARNSASQMQIH